MKKTSLAILIITFFLPLIALAQDFNDDIDDVPVDGGLSLLLAAGVGYGAQKIKNLKKKKAQ
jgi:hypothetical protein